MSESETIRMLRTYTVKEIRQKEKDYCGTCEGYDIIVAEMTDEGGDSWSVCDGCLKEFREKGAKFAVPSKAVPTSKWADDLRAACAYPFNPARKVSNKRRYEDCLEGVAKIAQEIQEWA